MRLAEAYTTYGVIGVKVWIFKGEVIGDKDCKLKQQLIKLQVNRRNNQCCSQSEQNIESNLKVEIVVLQLVAIK